MYQLAAISAPICVRLNHKAILKPCAITSLRGSRSGASHLGPSARIVKPPDTSVSRLTMAPSPTSRRRAEPEQGAEVGETGSERRTLEVLEAMAPQGEPQKRKKESGTCISQPSRGAPCPARADPAPSDDRSLCLSAYPGAACSM